jgi:hypothetical protein
MRQARLPLYFLLLPLLAALAPASLQAQSVGGIRVTDSTGSTPAGSVFTSRDQVYLAAGPADAQCAGEGLADGDYSFQVNDVAGAAALSTDDISNRTFTVSGGVISGYSGNHAVSPATSDCGSLLIQVAPFSRTRNGVYTLSVFCLSCVTPDATPAFVTSIAFAVRENLHCLETHCVSGLVFRDDNDNGLQDAGEPGLAGVVVSATSPGHAIVYGETDVDGAYSICGLTEDSYTIAIVANPNFQETFPSANRQISRYLFSQDGGYALRFCNANFAGLNFGLFPLTGAITGLKFNDANANGAQDAGEAGVSGVTINLLDSQGNTVSTQVTAADGTFDFEGITPGQYSLTETLPAGFEQTVPGGAGAISVTVVAGQTASGNVFGNHALPTTGSITGLKFDDTNGNGVQDSGEGGLADVTINLLTPAGVVLSTVTAADGTFAFSNLDPGSYTVGEVVPPGYHQTFPAPPGTTTVTVTAGQSVSVLFGNQANSANPASISGFIFYDLNKDMVQDNNEQPFATVTVNLMDTSGAVIATAVTDANGNFSFTNVSAPGDYLVQPVPPVNFFQTLPPGNAPIAVHVDPGQNVTGLIFGLSC